MRKSNGFSRELMIIVNSNLPEAQRMMAVCCLSDNVRTFYGNTSGEMISQEEKSYLRTNIIEGMSLVCNIPSLR